MRKMTANRSRMILLLPWAGCRIKKLKRTTCAACAKARAAAGGDAPVQGPFGHIASMRRTFMMLAAALCVFVMAGGGLPSRAYGDDGNLITNPNFLNQATGWSTTSPNERIGETMKLELPRSSSSPKRTPNKLTAITLRLRGILGHRAPIFILNLDQPAPPFPPRAAPRTSGA